VKEERTTLGQVEAKVKVENPYQSGIKFGLNNRQING